MKHNLIIWINLNIEYIITYIKLSTNVVTISFKIKRAHQHILIVSR